MKPRLPKTLFSAVLSVLTIGAIAPASGATHTWNGTSSKNVWNDTTNKTWSNASGDAELWSAVKAGDTITFGSGAKTKDIQVKSADITVSTYIVFADTYTVSSTKYIEAQSVSFTGGSSFTLVNTSGSSAADYLKISKDVKVQNDYTFYMDKTIDWRIGNSLVIDSGKALTLAVAENAHKEAGGEALITTAKINLGTGSSLTVNKNVTFNITNGGSLESAITNSGTLSMRGSFTSTGMDVIKGTATHYSEGDNGFAVTEGDKIIVVKGTGALSATGVTLTQDGVGYTLNDKTGVAQAAETTDYTTYYLNSGDGSVSDMAKAASAKEGKLTTVDMSSTGTLKVDADLNTLNAHTHGGTVDMTLGKAIANMTVNADTTILTAEGKTVETTMEVESGKEVSIEGEGGIKTGGVVIAGRDNETPATIANGGESADYAPGNHAMKISHATVEVTDGSAAVGDLLTINNKLTDTKLINKSGVTVRSTDGAGLTDIAAISGNVAVTNLAALSLDTLTIAAGEQVGVYTGNEMTEAAVAELTVKGTLTVGGAGASLNANLTLGSGSVLDLSAGSALTLGCTLGLEDGLTFVLSEQQLNDLTTGGSVLLMDGVDALSGTLPTSFTVTDSVGQAFGGPVALTYQGTELRLVPEPATATLSLLALAGLAARRRRK